MATNPSSSFSYASDQVSGLSFSQAHEILLKRGLVCSTVPSAVVVEQQHQALTGLQYDSRRVTLGNVFVAIQGLSVDGHSFIDAAVKQGAALIVCERLPSTEPPFDCAYIQVSNSRKALAVLAHAWYNQPSRRLKVFGVTGTNGKTTATFLLKTLLEACGETVGVIGTTGNFIGDIVLPADFTTPESVELCALLDEMARRGASAVAMEVSSHALALDRVYATTFAGAIFTNLTQDHLDFHKTMEEYAAAKKRLFDMLPTDAVAVANADDAYARFMLADTQAARRVFVGRSAGTDVRVVAERVTRTETRFSLVSSSSSPNRITNTPQDFSMKLVGRFNIDNAAGCLALCLALYQQQHSDYTEQESFWQTLRQALQAAEPAPGRMQRIPLPNGAAAIVDYAHTPDALEKALRTCRELLIQQPSSSVNTRERSAKLVCLFGCGGNRDRTKRPIMGALAAQLADMVVVTSDNPRQEPPEEIVQDILHGVESVPEAERAVTLVSVDRAEAIKQALASVAEGDIVLLAGKGHETYQILSTGKIHFDDAEQVREWVARSTAATHSAGIEVV
jgi:UDP-N-acetylmuramyl-tripeptide synthetase